MNATSMLSKEQLGKCNQYGVEPVPCNNGSKVGIAENVKSGKFPLNALRCNPTGNTCGWYIWAGEWSDSDDFFQPIHVEHLDKWCPAFLPFLQLPPGWRVQLAPNHEDVWLDPQLEL